MSGLTGCCSNPSILEFEASLVWLEVYWSPEIQARSLSHRQHQETLSCGSGFSLDRLWTLRYAEGQPR